MRNVLPGNEGAGRETRRASAAPHRWGRRDWTAAAVLCALAGAAPVARAGIEVAAEYPREGVPVRLTVTLPDGAPAAGDTVRAVYRPSSQVSRDETVGIVGVDGRLDWTPLESGVVTLSASPPAGASDRAAETRNLSVLFAKTPVSGLVVLLVAGFILYGGVISGFRRLNEAPPHLPPDT